MIELPLSNSKSVCVDILVSPVFCRLKGDINSLRLSDQGYDHDLNAYQTYIAVWDIKERFYLYLNNKLVSVIEYEDYFLFYDKSENRWRHWDDTVVSPLIDS